METDPYDACDHLKTSINKPLVIINPEFVETFLQVEKGKVIFFPDEIIQTALRAVRLMVVLLLYYFIYYLPRISKLSI